MPIWGTSPTFFANGQMFWDQDGLDFFKKALQ